MQKIVWYYPKLSFIMILQIKKIKYIYQIILKSINGEVLFSQLLPYVGNMKEMGLEPKKIIKIVETFLEKYPFVDETHKKDIYKMICTPEEFEKYKEEIKCCSFVSDGFGTSIGTIFQISLA